MQIETEAVSELTAVKQHADSMRAEAAIYSDRASGDQHAQGDVLFTRLTNLPAGAKKVDTRIQIVPGTTQGSRHILRSVHGVTMYQVRAGGPLDGPIIVSDERIVVDHPEHQTFDAPPGIEAVTFQRAFAEELRRVQD